MPGPFTMPYQPRVDGPPDMVDVDPAAADPQRRDVEQHHRTDVHVGALVLDAEEGGVHRAQPLVVRHVGVVLSTRG